MVDIFHKVLLLGLAFVAFSTADPCVDKCTKSFAPHTNQLEGSFEGCTQGCRLYSVVTSAEKMTPNQEDDKETMKNCKHSCEDAMESDHKNPHQSNKLAGCQSGCEFQRDVLKRSEVAKSSSPNPHQSVWDFMFGDDIFNESPLVQRGGDDKNPPGMTFSIGLPRMDDFDSSFGQMRMPDWVQNHVNSMMNSMRNRMKWMAESAANNDNGNGNERQFGGKLVVIQAGPGYREQKTYDIGPHGIVPNDMKNDMIESSNPLETFFNEDKDVEVFDPTFVQESPDNNRQIKMDPEEQIKEDLLIPIIRELNKNVHNGEYDFEEPHLPKNGLRSRNQYYADLCRQDSSHMKWSDWVSCLHLRLGMPRWLMASSMCLGIIFILWLCLVIPHNAPRQRVKRTEPPMSAKEAEALAIITVKPGDGLPMDLPPAYDDVANLKVKLEPVPLPEKVPENKV